MATGYSMWNKEEHFGRGRTKNQLRADCLQIIGIRKVAWLTMNKDKTRIDSAASEQVSAINIE